MKMVIGLDVHSKITHYFSQNLDGQTIREGAVTTSVEGLSEMVGQLNAPLRTRIGLETGTQATLVARILSSLKMNPVVIDAREVRQKARRKNQKSDRRDAFEICDGLRRGIYVCEVYVPDIEVQQLRRIISRRRHFVKLSTKQINAAKYIIRAEGLGKHLKTLNTWTAWQKLLAKPALADFRDHLEMHAQVWLLCRENVAKLEREMEDALKPFKKTEKLLRSTPGVGLICATTFIATLGRVDRFPTGDHVASYIGLVPSGFDSGDAVRRGHITKAGSPECRAMLCEAVHHAAKATHPLNPYWRKIAFKSGYRKAVVAVAHRLARILFQMWRKGEAFDVSKLNVICEKTVKQKTYHYRLKKDVSLETAC